MLAVRKTAPQFGIQIEEVSVPGPPGPEEAIIEVVAAGICGTDVHIYEWTPGYEWMEPLMPITLGHEFAGYVRAAGDGVQGVTEGDAVAVWPSSTCGTCSNCRAGKSDYCSNRSRVGLTQDGGFARFVRVPAKQCFPVSPHVDLQVAALSEPLAVGAHAVERGDVEPGDRVVVLGCGPIGLGTALFAKRAGAGQVIVVGKGDEARLACAGQLGFDTIDLDEEDLDTRLGDLTGGTGIDRVFEASGQPVSIRDGLRILRNGGILVAIGIHPEPAAVDITRLVREKKQIRGSHGSVRSTWSTVINAIEEAPDVFRSLVPHRFPLSEATAAFEAARGRDAVKVMLEP